MLYIEKDGALRRATEADVPAVESELAILRGSRATSKPIIDLIISVKGAEAIYQAFPRKVGKKAALKAIEQAIKEAGYQPVLASTRRYAEAVAKWPAKDRAYIPHPATWFRRGSYHDDPREWERGTAAALSRNTLDEFTL